MLSCSKSTKWIQINYDSWCLLRMMNKTNQSLFKINFWISKIRSRWLRIHQKNDLAASLKNLRLGFSKNKNLNKSRMTSSINNSQCKSLSTKESLNRSNKNKQLQASSLNLICKSHLTKMEWLMFLSSPKTLTCNLWRFLSSLWKRRKKYFIEALKINWSRKLNMKVKLILLC